VHGKKEYWTNASVLTLAGNEDPIQVITQTARTVVFKALQDGWSGPPFDPVALAEYLKISVLARDDVQDARTTSTGKGLTIEFNPNRPHARVRYSICHEIAHTLFPDCKELVRYRLAHEEMSGDDWQLEMLCNIAAAELLMPIGSLPPLEAEHLTIDTILELRKKYEASTEAVLLRAARITSEPCSIFSASRRESAGRTSYQIDYAVPSKSWNYDPIQTGFRLREDTVIAECTAIGFTAKAQEDWSDSLGKLRVECVGIPSYPGHAFPRVAGLAKLHRTAPSQLPKIKYLKGDATQPRGTGLRIIAQVVNDRASTWGAGFALAIRKKWPHIQESFRLWAATPSNFQLGNIHSEQIDTSTDIFSMICQHGYGPSPKPRIRYEHLKSCLSELAGFAEQRKASVHIPRIGSGQAGGNWEIISELIDQTLCRQNISVTVYDPPHAEVRPHSQPILDFTGSN
jgi:hypothetical protein